MNMIFAYIAGVILTFFPVIAFAGYSDMTPNEIEISITKPDGHIEINLLADELNSERGKALIEKCNQNDKLKYRLYFNIPILTNTDTRDHLILACLKNPARSPGTSPETEVSLANQLSDYIFEYFPDIKINRGDYEATVICLLFVSGRNELAAIFEKLLEIPLPERKSPGPEKELLQNEIEKVIGRYRNADYNAEIESIGYPDSPIGKRIDAKVDSKHWIGNVKDPNGPGVFVERANKKPLPIGKTSMTEGKKLLSAIIVAVLVVAGFLFLLARRIRRMGG